MSVINQMLRDLDRRTMPADRAVYASHINRQSRRNLAKWGTVGTLIIAAGIAIGAAIMRWNEPGYARHVVDLSAEETVAIVNESPSIIAEEPPLDAPAEPVAPADATSTAIIQAPVAIVPMADPKPTVPNPSVPKPSVRPAEPKVVKQQLAAAKYLDDPLEKLVAGMGKESLPAAPPTAAPASLAIHPPVDATRAPTPRIDKRVLGDETTLTAEAAFRRAAHLIDQGRLTEAQDRLREALDLDARHEPARQTLAALLLESKSYDAADAVLAAGLQRNPAQTNFALALSRLHLERGNMPGALSVLREHEQFAIGHAEYRAFAAALHGKAGAHAKAIAEYQAALRLTPRVGSWWVGLGLAHEAEDRMDAATQAYRNARDTGTLSANLSEFVDRKLQRKP